MFKIKYYIVLYITVSLLLLSACKAAKAKGSVNDTKPVVKSTNIEPAFGNKFIDGCNARMKRNYEEALALFLECAKLDPANAPTRYELAKLYLEKNNNLLALENAKLCAAADTKNEYYQIILIDCYNTNKQYQQAIKARENLVKSFPNNSEFKEDLAIQYSIAGFNDKALAIYNDLEVIYGVNEQISLNKVKLFKRQQKLKEAEQELIKLTESNPSEPRLCAYLAEFYEEKGDKVKMKEMYDKILKLDPSIPTVNLALSDYYYSINQPNEAFTFLKQAFLNPDLDVNTKASIASTYYSRAEQNPKSNYKELGKELSGLFLKTHPKNADANGIYADFLMLEDNKQEASKYYYNAAFTEKNNYHVWEQLLFIYHDLRNYDSLKVVSAKAMDIFASQPNPYFFNGIANLKLKDYREAVKSLKDGLEFVVDNKAQMLNFYANLGDAYNSLKEYEKSDKAFDDALKIDADNTMVLNNYAYYISLRKTDLDRAEKLSKKCNELAPNNRNYMDTYGWILFQQNKFSEAETWLSNAVKIGNPNPNILEHYGDVLFKLNKIDDALKQWELAKKAGSINPQLDTKIKTKKLD